MAWLETCRIDFNKQVEHKRAEGLSATPWRRDKLSRLIYWSLGDVVHEISKDKLLKTGDVLSVEVVTRQTEFRTLLDPSEQYSWMLSELTQNAMRNELIASDVAGEARKGKRYRSCGTQ
jgi:superfamily II DNA or RNA helicase